MRDRPAVGGTESTAAAGLDLKARSQWSYARSRFFRHRMAVVGLIGLVIIFGAGIFANYIAPYSFAAIDLNNLQHAPTTVDPTGSARTASGAMSSAAWFTGSARRSRSVSSSLSSRRSSALIVGAVAGYFGGVLDNVLMRITDLVLTLPALAILLAVSALLGDGSQWTHLVHPRRASSGRASPASSAASSSPCARRSTSRLRRRRAPATRGSCSGTSSRTRSGRSSSTHARRRRGDPDRVRALVPRLRHPAAAPSLGALVADGQNYPLHWWLTIFPGVLIVLIVLCVNFVGDGLRDALDPHAARIRA